MQHHRPRYSALRVGALLLIAAVMLSCSDRDSLPVVLQVGEPTVSRLPYVIAYDQGLYEKYGLNLELRLREPGPGGQVISHTNFLTRMSRALGIVDVPRPDIIIGGATPMMVSATRSARAPPYSIVIASTDCVVRAHIIGRRGITSLEELKGKRLGVSSLNSTTGLQALLFAERMGWDATNDISIMANADGDVGLLMNNTLDALVGNERAYADAIKEGLPVLADMREWNDVLAGNSARIRRGWLNDDMNHEAARRFLKATIEGIALFHQQPEIAMQVMGDWYGFEDREYADNVYSRGAWIPQKPYPCYEGLNRTKELYDSNEMRRYSPQRFFNDSLVRELDDSGFIDDLYR